MASLTNSGVSVLDRMLEEGSPYVPLSNAEEDFEVSRCVQWILTGGYRKVGLQFPDELLSDAASVCRSISRLVGFSVYILGDTTYCSCCVDEVAAEHIGADAIIHFGRTCLSPSRRLPVLYIFTKLPVDVTAVMSGIYGAIEDQNQCLILAYDVRCHYVAGEISSKLIEKYPRLVLANLEEEKCHVDNKNCCNVNWKQCCINDSEEGCSYDQNETDSCKQETPNCFQSSGKQELTANNKTDTGGIQLTFSGRCVNIHNETTIKDYDFIYLGPESPTLTSLLSRFSENSFFCVNPSDGVIKSVSGITNVMRRSGKLEMAKDAEIIGILVGTLGVADYRNVITRLKSVIKAAGKKSYTFVVGKPNEPKLANISEVDLFVYVACPETSLVERSTDPVLYRKLITPWELEVALLPGQVWNLELETDFRQLLPGGSRHVELPSQVVNEEVSVSLLTNKTQRFGIRDEEDKAVDSVSGAVILQDGKAISAIHVGGAGQVLKSKTWQGLDPSISSPTPIGSVVEGRSGIASIYRDEVKVNDNEIL